MISYLFRAKYPNALYADLTALGLFVAWFYHVSVLGANDAAWHLATGSYILAHGLPSTDPWSYTAHGTPWYIPSWIFDIAIAYISQHLGQNALFLIILLGYLALLPILARRCIAHGADYGVTMLICWISGFVLGFGAGLRPAVLTTWFCLLFTSILQSERSRPAAFRPWLLPVLMVVWVNCHGGFMAGLTIVGAFCVEAFYSKDRLRQKRLLGQCALVLIATFVSPYGYASYTDAIATMRSALTPYIGEWWALDGREYPILLGYALLILVAFAPDDPGTPLAEKLLVLFWTIASFLSIRYFLILAVIATPYTAYRWSSILRCCRWQEAYLRYEQRFRNTKTSPEMRRMSTCTVTAAVALLCLPVIRQQVWQGGDWQNNSKLPVEELAFVRSHYPGMRFINDPDIGSSIVLAGPETVAPFIDGRVATAYPESLMRDFAYLMAHRETIGEMRRRYRASGYFLGKGFYERFRVPIAAEGCRKELEGAAAIVLVCETTLPSK